MHFRPAAAAALMIAMALSGCAGEPTPFEPTEPVGEASPQGEDATDNATVTDNGTLADEMAVAMPPAADVTLSAFNGTVPWTFNVTINGTDLAYNVTLTGADGTTDLANGTAPATIPVTIETAGIYTLNVTVSDGTLANATGFVIEAFAGGPLTLSHDDPDDDGSTDMTEIEDITVSLDDKFTIVAKVADVPTASTTPALLPWGYRLRINGEDFHCYNYAGVSTFSGPGGGYIGGCTWSEADDTVTMVISVDHLTGNGILAPYAFSLTSYVGALVVEAEADDAVPDSGTLVI